MTDITFSQRLLVLAAVPLLVSAFSLYYRDLGFNLHSLQCSILSKSLPGRVSYPESAAYTSSTASYWSTLESALSPACIVTPRDTKDVAIAINLLVWMSLNDAGQLAIRIGGHTPWAGSANIDGGITMDPSYMRTISFNQNQSVVSVGAGSIWGDVYRRTDALGIAVIGGRGSSIGVEGLTLGGMHALWPVGAEKV